LKDFPDIALLIGQTDDAQRSDGTKTIQRQNREGGVPANAYQKLRRLLATSQLRPHEHLRISELAERLSVGITPLREALIRLAAEGLVTLHPKRGFFAKGLTTEELAELYVFGNYLLRSSLRWGTAGMVGIGFSSDLAAGLNDARRGQAAAAAARAVELLNEQIVGLSGNTEMLRAIRGYNDRTSVARLIYVEQVEQVESTSDYVRTMIDLLETDDRQTIAARLQQRFETKMLQVPRLVKEVASRAFSSHWSYEMAPPCVPLGNHETAIAAGQGAFNAR
jgi:DNA-binding GntR family transcriptional regulator